MKKYLVLLALLLAQPAIATDITYSDKSEGGTFTHSDANEIKTAVNSKADETELITSGSCVDNAIVLTKADASTITTTIPCDSDVNIDIVEDALVVSYAGATDSIPISSLDVNVGSITVDSAIIENGTNPVTGDAIYDALVGKVNTNDIETEVIDSSGRPVSSNAVYDALAGKVDADDIETEVIDNSGRPVSSNAVHDALAEKLATTPSQHIVPDIATTYNLGSSLIPWNYIHGDKGRFYGSLTLDGSPVITVATDPFTLWDKDYDDLINTPAIPTVDSAIIDGSTNPVTGDAIEAALAGKQDAFTGTQTVTATGLAVVTAESEAAARTAIGAEAADATILKSADIGVTVQGYDADTMKADAYANQAALEAALGWSFAGGSGAVATTVPTYSDEACSPGNYAYSSSPLRKYECFASGDWNYWDVANGLVDWDNPTPTTYQAAITITDGNGTDKITYNSTDYTTSQTFTGLSADVTITATADTDREATWSSLSGCTDNGNGSITCNTDTENGSATVTFADESSGTPVVIASQEYEGTSTQNLNSYDVGQSFTVSTTTDFYSLSIYRVSGTGTTTCRIGTSTDLSTTYLEELIFSDTSTGWLETLSSTNPELSAGTYYIACSGSDFVIGREEGATTQYADGTYYYGTSGGFVVDTQHAARDLDFIIKGN